MGQDEQHRTFISLRPASFRPVGAGANDHQQQINTQAIPPSSGLAAKLPSGRDIHSPPAPYTLPQLDDGTLAALRAAPGPETMDEAEADSSEEEGYY